MGEALEGGGRDIQNAGHGDGIGEGRSAGSNVGCSGSVAPEKGDRRGR